MKMKRFLSLVLAMVMSLALAAPAFAAEPDEGIMPPAKLYSDNNINANNDTYKPAFTTTPGAGKYLRVWFRNKGAESVVVTLCDYNTRERLMSKTFIPNDPNDTFLYTIPTPEKACSYYLNFVSIGDSGARVTGQAAAAQYRTDPDGGIMPLTQIFYDDLNLSSGNPTQYFTTTPVYGKYLRVWVNNHGTETVKVMLYPYGSSTDVASFDVPVNVGGRACVYEIPTPDKPCTFYLRIESMATGARVIGSMSVAQYRTDPDEGIMPLAQVYAEEPVSTSSGNSVGPFTTTPDNGKYLQVWFLNQGAAPVNVMLLDHATGKVLASRSVPVGGGGEVLIYEIPTPNKPCTYRIRFECPPNGDWITGRVAAAQYTTKPSN